EGGVGKVLKAVPVDRQLRPVQEHHEIGQHRMGVNSSRTDLPHQIHAHGVAAECEESAVPERKNAAIAPDQIDRQCQQRKTKILAEQRHEIRRQVKRRALRDREIEHRNENSDRRQRDQKGECAAIERAREQVRHHASTARPFRANNPRGRFWMNKMIRTSIAILPSTAPAEGSRNLLAMPSVNAPTSVPHRLPTPPNTTTMKESMM